MQCAFVGHRCSTICSRTPREGQLYVDWLSEAAELFQQPTLPTADLEAAQSARAAAEKKLQALEDATEKEREERAAALKEAEEKGRKEAKRICQNDLTVQCEQARRDGATEKADELLCTMNAQAKLLETTQGMATKLNLELSKVQETLGEEREKQDRLWRSLQAVSKKEQERQQELEICQRELEDCRKAVASPHYRGKLSEMELHDFCRSIGEGIVLDVSRDGHKADLLVTFPNRRAVKIESKAVLAYKPSFEDDAFARLDELGSEHDVNVAAVVVVNTHPTAKAAFGTDDLGGHNHAYEARNGVFGHYLSGGADLWQPGLRTILQLVNKLPALAEVDVEDMEWEAFVKQKEEVAATLKEFKDFLEEQAHRLTKDKTDASQRLEKVKKTLVDVKKRMSANYVEDQEKKNVLVRAASLVEKRGRGLAHFTRLKDWDEFPDLHPHIKRFWPKNFKHFLEELQNSMEPAPKKQRLWAPAA